MVDRLGRLCLGFTVGAVASLALPGIGLWPLYFLGTLWLDVVSQRTARLSTALWLGVGWSLGFLIPYYQGALTWGTGVAVTLIALHTGTVFLPRVLWNFAVGQRAPNGPLLVGASVAVSALWLSLLEHVGFPTTLAAATVIDVTPLVAGVRIIGGAGFDALLFGASVGAATFMVEKRFVHAAATIAAVTALLLLLSGAAWLTAPEPGRSLEVGIVQMNVDETYYRARVLHEGLRASFEERLTAVLERLNGVELLVTPESFDGRFNLLFPPLVHRWSALAADHERALLLATYLSEADGKKSNAVAAFDANGELVAVHRKVHLAPFGEASLSAGERATLLPVASGVTVGPAICLESILPVAVAELVDRGANLLVAQTSDVSFRSSALPFVHLHGSRLRALEAGRAMVWASNGGPSGVIDRWGRFAAGSGFREAAAVRARATLHRDRAPFLVLQPFLLVLCAAVALGCTARLYRHARAPDPQRDESRRGLQKLVPLATAIVCAASIAVTPAWVQLARGDPNLAWLAVGDLYHGPAVVVGNPADPWAAFRSDNTAAGALSYLLAQYGFYEPTSSLDALELASLNDTAAQLLDRYEVHTMEVPVLPEPPVLAVLVQLIDGSFAVLLNYSQSDQPTLFLSTVGQARPISLEQLTELLAAPVGLMPRAPARK